MTVRPHIVRILIARDWLRLSKNPSAIMLMALLVAIALLLTTSDRIAAQFKQPERQATCWIVYWEADGWIDALHDALDDVPDGAAVNLIARQKVPGADDALRYPPGDMAIEIHPPRRDAGGHGPWQIRYRHPGANPGVLWPSARWFWKTTAAHFGSMPGFIESVETIGGMSRSAAGPVGIETLGESSISDLVTVELIASVMLFLVQFFACCHLLVSFTSRDRERGTLMALALTPATTSELLATRFLFHLMISVSVCGVMVGLLKPAALLSPLLWGVVSLSSLGLMAIGTIIASLSRSQTTAGLLTLCYMLVTGVVFYLASRFSTFAWIKQGMLEHYTLPLTYLSIKYSAGFVLPPMLISLALLTGAWVTVAASVFRRYGWR